MSERVTIERLSKDKLTKWMWEFWYDKKTLWLDYYAELQRPTRRHGFSESQRYSRLNKRFSTINESDVVLPADLKGEAIKKLCEGITIKRWSERK